MRSQLKRLGSDTAIYGISTILGRALNFLLLPFYTNVLLPGDYGIVSYLFSIIAFVNVLYSYGMESSYFKYSSTLEIGTKKQNFGTPFTALLVSSVTFSAIIALAAGPIAGALNIASNVGSLVTIAAGVLACDAIAIVPFAALRMEHKPRVFATIKFVTIAITVVMNILLLVVAKMGVTGIFLSNLIASASAVVMLIPTIRRNFSFDVNAPLLKALLRFGLPFIPAGLATMAVQVIDRPILRALTDDATVGIYQANYRLGIFMMLVVQMYDFAWRPFYFSNAGAPNAKELFARVLTYFALFMSGIFLAVSFFIDELVKIHVAGHYIIHPNYWGGLGIVPIVLGGYMFLGISNNMSAGIYIQKKTSYMPPIAFVGAFVNIAANVLLIPSMGMVGAAWATFLAYLAMACMMYIIVRRIYPVPYEFGRLAKIFGAAAIAYIGGLLVQADGLSFGWRMGAKVAVLLLFAGLMFIMRFFEPREMAFIRGMFNRPTVEGPDVDTNLL